MSEYSDKQQEANQEQVERWLNEFIETEHFSSLSDAEKDHADFIIGGFTEYMYSYEGKAPDKWSLAAMESVCVNIFPRKVTAEDECFEAVAPVLRGFFKFLSEKNYQPHAAKLAEKVLTLQSRIISAAKDPSNWGMAKSFAMMAEKSGYDITDPSQSEAFIANYNAQLSAGLTEQKVWAGLSLPILERKHRVEQQRKEKRKAQKAARKKSRGR